MLAVFMNTYRSPLPVQQATLTTFAANTLLLHWTSPRLPDEIPAINQYEIELVNTNTSTSLALPPVKTPCLRLSAR